MPDPGAVPDILCAEVHMPLHSLCAIQPLQQGEGRAVAASKALLLGEALPPLRLVLQDSHGNALPGAAWAEQSGRPQLRMLAAAPGGAGAVLQELQVDADMVGTRQHGHCAAWHHAHVHKCLGLCTCGTLVPLVTPQFIHPYLNPTVCTCAGCDG
jgi:hypothetical protein